MAFFQLSTHRGSHAWFDIIGTVLLLIGTIVFPLFYLPFTRDVLFFPKALFLLFLVLLGILLWFVRLIVTKEFYIRRTILDIPIAVFLILTCVSGLASYSISFSFLGRVDEYVFHIVSLFTILLWYWIMIQQITGTLLWRWLISGLLISGICSSLFFLGSTWFSFPYISTGSSGNLFSLISTTPSVFGVYIGVLTIISFGFLLVRGRSWSQRILPICMAVLGYVSLLRLGFTLPWVLFTIGLLLVLVLGMTLLADVSMWLLGVYAFLFICSLLFVVLGTPSFLKTALPIEIALGARSSFHIAWEALLQNGKTFFLGTGPGTFIYSFSSYKPEAFNLNDLVWSVRFRQPYSSFFAFIAELGVFGVVSWLFLVLFAVGSIFSAWIKTRPTVWKKVVSSLHRSQADTNDSMHILRFDVFVLAAAWIAFTCIFFFVYYDFTLWWLWWTMLALVFIGLSSMLPKIMSGKHFLLQLSPQYTLVTSFGFMCFLVVIVLFGAFETRLYAAEVFYTSAVRSSSLTHIESSIQHALRYRSQHVPYRLASARFYLQQARIASQASPVDPERVASFVSLAINDARFAADHDTHNVETWETLAAMYMSARVFTQDANTWAQQALTTVIALEPTNAVAYWRLADTYIFLKDFAEAEKQLKQSIRLKPNYIPPYRMLAELYGEQNEFSKAIDVYQPVFSLIQDSPEQLTVLGRLFLNRAEEGDRDRAQSLWEKAIALNPNYADPLFGLALVHEQKGNIPQSLAYYERVLALNPDNAEIAQKIELLQQ